MTDPRDALGLAEKALTAIRNKMGQSVADRRIRAITLDATAAIHAALHTPSPTPAPATGDTDEPGISTGGRIITRSDVIERLGHAGEHLGNAIAGYRDKNNDRAAHGLWEAATAMLDAKVLLSQPPVPPAAEGWWVKPEWRPAHDYPDGLGLYICGQRMGVLYNISPNTWFAKLSDGTGRANHDTREAAQAALLAAVRPKDAGGTT